MTTPTSEGLATQLRDLLNDFQEMSSTANYDDLSDLPAHRVLSFVTRSLAAVSRIAGPGSVYAAQASALVKPNTVPGYQAQRAVAIVHSLLMDVEAGYLASLRELLHAEVFGDFLEMSEHLLEKGFKDPAAVIAGSSLEAHLRRIGQKNGLEVEDPGGRPLKAERLNADLKKAGAYGQLDQKNVTAWLGLRNLAAHGHYDKYDEAQVRLLVSSVRDFLTRNPA